MRQLIRRRAGSKATTILRFAAAAVLCLAALGRPDLSLAARGGGGGFHGGGFHGVGFGGSWRGGYGGWHGGYGGVHNGYGGRWYHGRHNGRYGWWWWGPGLGWAYYAYPYGWGYSPDYGNYGDYGYGEPYAGQY